MGSLDQGSSYSITKWNAYEVVAVADIGQSEHIDIRTKIGAVAPTGVHDTACRALQLPDLLVPSA